MSFLSQIGPSPFRRDSWVTFAFFALALAGAYKAAGYIIVNDTTSLLYRTNFYRCIFYRGPPAELAERGLSVSGLAPV
jgi:hypothetical protein